MTLYKVTLTANDFLMFRSLFRVTRNVLDHFQSTEQGVTLVRDNLPDRKVSNYLYSLRYVGSLQGIQVFEPFDMVGYLYYFVP